MTSLTDTNSGLLCKIGLHRYRPAKSFDSQERKMKYWLTSIHGFECNCGKRKIKIDKQQPQTPGATQEAYDWLNQRPQQATILRIVK